MKIEIKKGNKKFLINLKQITQIIGTNMLLKNYIIESLFKHFTNTKYLDYEEEKIDNILCDNKIIGKKYFNTYYIRNKNDILDNIKIGKATLMFKYLEHLLNNFDNQQDINNIDIILHNLFSRINNIINQNIENITIDYNIEDMINIIAKTNTYTKDNDSLYTMSSLSLLKTYIQLIKVLYDKTPTKILILIENIDHIISKEQYDILLKSIPDIIETREIYILFTSSIDNFVYVSKNTLTGINVINNIVFNVPNIESINDFLERTYPSYLEFDEATIFDILTHMLNSVGNENDYINMHSTIFLILFNRTLSITTKVQNKLNDTEIAFINS